MALFHEPRGARKVQLLQGCSEEVMILVSQAGLRSWSVEHFTAIESLCANEVRVRILVEETSFRISQAQWTHLRSLGAEVRLLRSSFTSLLFSRAPGTEVWVFDRKEAILESESGAANLGVEYLIGNEASKVAANYFEERWRGSSDGFSLQVRHKQFIFRGGRGSEREFFSCLLTANKEVILYSAEERISRPLQRALLETLQRGVQVHIYSLRTSSTWKKLQEAGATCQLLDKKLPVGCSGAIVDRSWVYIGCLPRQFSWMGPHRPVFFLRDKEVGANLAEALEGGWKSSSPSVRSSLVLHLQKR